MYRFQAIQPYFQKVIAITVAVIFCCFFFIGDVISQSIVSIDYTDSTIQLHEPFIITVHVGAGKLTSVSNFPEIEDFVKATTTFKKINTSYQIEQVYYPRKEGKFLLYPFYLSINSVAYRFPQKTIVVIKGKPRLPPFQSIDKEDDDYISMHPDVIFDISTTKTKIFTSEGFGLRVAFLQLKNSKTEINFIDLSEQIKNIIAKVKPKHCWEEQVAAINEPYIDSTTIGSKVYTRYVFFSSVFFPLQARAITIPGCGFNFLKYKVKKSSTKIERLPEYAVVKSAPFQIMVSATPAHPLKDRIPSGTFSLEDRLSVNVVSIDSPVKYRFTIKSKFGIGLIRSPVIFERANISIFTPQINTFSNPGGGPGRTTFEYQIKFKKGGSYLLKDYFYWVYFNTEKKMYDTLFPKSRIEIRKDTSASIASLPVIAYYDQIIKTSSNSLRNTKKDEQLKWIANSVIAVMLICTILLMIKR